MRVLYSTLQSRRDGSAIHAAELTRALQEIGVEVLHSPMFFLERGIGGWDGDSRGILSESLFTLRKVVPRVVKELAMPFFSAPSVAQELGRAQKIISGFAPDVLLLRTDYISMNYFWLSALVAQWKAAQNNLPLLLEVNAPLVHEFGKYFQDPRLMYWDYPFVASISEKMLWRKSNAVICVSSQLKDFLIRNGVHPEKIFVVPNGVNLDKFNLTVTGDEIREKYALQRKIVVGFAGSLKSWHGVDNLVKSIGIAVERDREIACLIVGDCGRSQNLKLLIEREGLIDHVVFTGNVPHDEIPSYIAAMDVTTVCYPPIEDFYFSPLKIFEYMAMAKPVIASKVGQIEELILHGRNGYLVDPGDQRGLAQAILELAHNAELRTRLGKDARKTVEERYTWVKSAQAVRDICETVRSGSEQRVS